MQSLQRLRQQVQRRVAIALGLDLLDRVQHVIAVDAGVAVALVALGPRLRGDERGGAFTGPP